MSMIFTVLSAKLAEITGKPEVSCRGVMRYAVRDTAKHLEYTTDYKVWQEHLQGMNFHDWDTLLQGRAFYEHLEKIGEKAPAKIIAQMRQTLVEKQALFTMSATPGRSL